MSHAVTVSNVRPIKEPFCFDLPTGWGIQVLTGPNESGKTNTLKAIGMLLGRKADLESDPDVPWPSFVDGVGVRITLGRRTRETGELGVDALDGLDPFSLVDPKIDDPLRADARRFAIICAAIGAKVDLDEFAKVLPAGISPSDVMSGKTRDLMDATLPEFTAAFRSDLKQQALLLEKNAEAALSEAAGYRQSAGATKHDDIVPDPKAISETLGSLRAQLQTVRGAVTKREVEEQEAHEAEQVLAKIDADASASAELEARLEANLREELRSDQMRVQKLKDDLRDAEEKCRATGRAVDNAKKALEIARQRVADADAARAFVKASSEKPSSKLIANGIPELEMRIERADAGLRNAIEQERRVADARKAHDAQTRAVRIQKDAAAYRAASLACEGVLSNVASRASTRHKILCVEGRMYVARNDESVAYHVLSQGAKSEIALSLFAECLSKSDKPTLLVICQEAWEGLDPDARDRVLDQAEDFGVGIVTAEAASGPLRAIPYVRSKPRVRATTGG